ncbi:MAG: DNA-3-methyladenine glycosylase [Candidatus Pacearchaeota archaeon]
MLRMNMAFYSQDAAKVAKNLLGKILCRNYKGKVKKARIIETEAYYDEKDPASRACKNGDLKKTMQAEAGTILVYGVHNNWLLNIVTGKKGEAQAVLIRAAKPINFKAKCEGPGMLTRALKIDKSFHKQSIIKNKNLWIENDKWKNFKIKSSHRIGVKKDLARKLRFFIEF